MAADVSTMNHGTTHPFTCNTCQVAFRNIDLQKGHMRSDWQYVVSYHLHDLDLCR